MRSPAFILLGLAVILFPAVVLAEESASLDNAIYDMGQLPPTDSVLNVAVGDPMPDFALPAIDGSVVRLEDYLGKGSLVISFVPAAWTPVCSDQWPGYNIVQDIFEDHSAALVGVSVDNVPTLHAWVTEMGGLWFPVASDFWPARRVGAGTGHPAHGRHGRAGALSRGSPGHHPLHPCERHQHAAGPGPAPASPGRSGHALGPTPAIPSRGTQLLYRAPPLQPPPRTTLSEPPCACAWREGKTGNAAVQATRPHRRGCPSRIMDSLSRPLSKTGASAVAWRAQALTPRPIA